MDTLNTKPSGYYLFGNDVFCIPCFRDSFLYGFSACTGTSLLTFLFTSSGIKSFKYAFGAFFFTAFPYMFYCQEKFYRDMSKIQEVQDRIREKSSAEFVVMDNLPTDELSAEGIV